MTKWVMMISVGVVAAALGCGGGAKKEPTTTTKTTTEDNGGTETKPPAPEISELKLVEIDAMLKRKRDSVSRCFGDALKAGELKKSDRGSVTVHWTISTSGKAMGARIGQATIKSKALNACILEKLGLWEFPTLAKELKYSYSFGFAYF